jgi:hypothetical protein
MWSVLNQAQFQLHTCPSLKIVCARAQRSPDPPSPHSYCKKKLQFGRRKPLAHQGEEEMRSCSREHMPRKVPSPAASLQYSPPPMEYPRNSNPNLSSSFLLLPLIYATASSPSPTLRRIITQLGRARLRKPEDCRSVLGLLLGCWRREQWRLAGSRSRRTWRRRRHCSWTRPRARAASRSSSSHRRSRKSPPRRTLLCYYSIFFS